MTQDNNFIVQAEFKSKTISAAGEALGKQSQSHRGVPERGFGLGGAQNACRAKSTKSRRRLQLPRARVTLRLRAQGRRREGFRAPGGGRGALRGPGRAG